MEVGDLKSTTAYYVDINVEITDNSLLMHSQSGSDVYTNAGKLLLNIEGKIKRNGKIPSRHSKHAKWKRKWQPHR